MLMLQPIQANFLSFLPGLGVFDKFPFSFVLMLKKVLPREDFKELILQYLDDLYRFAMSLCHNQADAEDLVSDTVLKAIENNGKLNDKTKAKQWLFRILSNQFIDQK